MRHLFDSNLIGIVFADMEMIWDANDAFLRILGYTQLETKILIVYDVVEAIAADRPYRPTQGIDKALEEILQNKGILYDPEAVDARLRLFREKGFKVKL